MYTHNVHVFFHILCASTSVVVKLVLVFHISSVSMCVFLAWVLCASFPFLACLLCVFVHGFVYLRFVFCFRFCLPFHFTCVCTSTAQLRQSGLVAKLRELLDNGPRQRYHASRGLVYMGELDLGNVSVFDENGEE